MTELQKADSAKAHQMLSVLGFHFDPFDIRDSNGYHIINYDFGYTGIALPETTVMLWFKGEKIVVVEYRTKDKRAFNYINHDVLSPTGDFPTTKIVKSDFNNERSVRDYQPYKDKSITICILQGKISRYYWPFQVTLMTTEEYLKLEKPK